MAEQENWERVIAGLRRGDREIAQQFWDRYGSDIEGIVKNRWARRLLRREGAEDLVQSIFRTFFRRIQEGEFQLENSQDLFLLLFGIARRKVAKKVRFHQAKRRDARREVRTVSKWEDSPSLEARDPRPSPPEIVETAELVEQLRQAMESLEERQRQILEQRLQGDSTEEIAEKLGISDSMVRRYLRQAKARLERQLKDE